MEAKFYDDTCACQSIIYENCILIDNRCGFSYRRVYNQPLHRFCFNNVLLDLNKIEDIHYYIK